MDNRELQVPQQRTVEVNRHKQRITENNRRLRGQLIGLMRQFGGREPITRELTNIFLGELMQQMQQQARLGMVRGSEDGRALNDQQQTRQDNDGSDRQQNHRQ